jgi:hypothetical protein
MSHPILQFFDTIEVKSTCHRRVTCKLCGLTFTSSPSRLVFHIAKMSGRGISVCKTPLDPADTAKVEAMVSKRRNFRQNTVDLSTINEPMTLTATAHEKWAQFFYAEAIPFRKIDGPWFKEAIAASIAVGPNYKPPNRRHLSNELLNATVSTLKQTVEMNLLSNIAQTGSRILSFTHKLIHLFSHSPHSLIRPFIHSPIHSIMLLVSFLISSICVCVCVSLGFSLVSDGKDSNGRDHLINVIMMTPKGGTFLKTINHTGIRNARSTAQLMIDVIDELPLHQRQNLVAVVTDTPNVNRAAGQMIECAIPSITWIPCLTHSLNLVFKDSTKIPQIGTLYEEAKLVVHHFYARSVPRQILRELLELDKKHSVAGVLKVCELRFSNMFLVLERLLHCQFQIKMAVTSEQHCNWCTTLQQKDRRKVEKVMEIVQRPTFWNYVQQYITIFAPVHSLLRQVDSNAIMMGKVYKLMSELDQHFVAACKLEYLNLAASELQSLFVTRWNLSHSAFHAAAYVLEPEFATHDQFSNTEVSDGYRQVTKTFFLSEPEKIALLDRQLLRFKQQEGEFAKPEAIENAKLLAGYEWWMLYGGSTPELKQIAIKVLSQPCCASAAEQNWAQYDEIHSKKRNKLGQTKASQVVYAGTNLRLQRNLQSPNFCKSFASAETSSISDASEPSEGEAEEVSPL